VERQGYAVKEAGTIERVGMPVVEEVREHGSKRTKKVVHTGLGRLAIYETDLPQCLG
jgi:hypothetical protein